MWILFIKVSEKEKSHKTFERAWKEKGERTKEIIEKESQWRKNKSNMRKFRSLKKRRRIDIWRKLGKVCV